MVITGEMGSEHYCLRWNDHQNNLLGVFSELLQEESLVDVTLACSEGHSIRAHKVVLSACSSYFQSLFLHHPNRHPIIILKDVCFAELRTLIEFMYKGEVNVEYCRLSTLLKTAESLQVKGLTDMTHLRSSLSPPAEILRDSAANTEEEEGSPLRCTSPMTPQPLPLTCHTRLPATEYKATADDILRTSLTSSPAIGRSASAEERKSVSPKMEEDNDDDDDDASSIQSGPSDMTPGSSRISSPYLRPIPGPSNMAPIQNAPLSLKIGESDWDKNEEKSSTSEPNTPDYGSTSSFRQLPDTERPSTTPELSSAGSSRQLHDTVMSTLEAAYQLPLRFSVPSTCSVSSRSSTAGSLDRLSGSSPRSAVVAAPFLFPPFGTLPVIPPPFLPGENSLSIYSFLQQQNLLPYSSPNDMSSMSQRTAFIKCAICLAAFPNGWLLEQHTLLQHSGQPHRKSHNTAAAGEKAEEKPFQCDQCGQSYRYRSAYVKHREQNHRARLPADKLFTCDICGMQFRYLKSFKKHRLNHSLETILPSGSGRKERSSTSDETGAASEPATDTDERSASAVSESQVSSSNEAVDPQSSSSAEAAARVEAVDSLALALSGGEPTLFNLLRYPVERQRERQLFSCSFCSKTVRSKENLKLHVRKHTGERPFACMFCGRAFGGKSDLTRHVRIHTGERPYHCEMCGKCFARADYLSKHLTTHLHNAPNPRVTTS